MTDWNRHYRMVKQKGDRKVKTWTHNRSGLSCDIFLRYTHFVALFLERTFDAPNCALLEKQLSDYAENWIQMKWYPVIHVEIEDPHNYRDELEKEGMDFGCTRYYVSISPAGEIFKVEWDVAEKHRKAQMQSVGSGYNRSDRLAQTIKLIGLPLEAPIKQGGNSWVMDYSDELWDGFQSIRSGLRMIRKRLTELISTKKGWEMLKMGHGGQLLLQT